MDKTTVVGVRGLLEPCQHSVWGIDQCAVTSLKTPASLWLQKFLLRHGTACIPFAFILQNTPWRKMTLLRRIVGAHYSTYVFFSFLNETHLHLPAVGRRFTLRLIGHFLWRMVIVLGTTIHSFVYRLASIELKCNGDYVFSNSIGRIVWFLAFFSCE